MPSPPHPGPHYISAAEYASVRRRRVRRRSAAALVLAAAAVVFGVWVLRVPRLRSAEQLAAASVAARSPIDAHAVVWLWEQGERVRFCDEWSTRDQTRLQYADPGVVVVKGHTEDTVWDPEQRELRYHVFDNYAPNIRTWIANHFYRASIRKDLKRLPTIESNGRALSRFYSTEGAERVLLWVDDATDRPVSVRLERRTAQGWIPAVEVASEFGIAIPPQLFSQPARPGRRVDLRGDNDPRKALVDPVAEVPIGTGSAIKIAAAEVNREGTVFVVFHTQSPIVPPYVTDDRGMVYFAHELGLYRDIPAVSYMFVPQTADAGAFAPRTIQVHFPSRGVPSGRLPVRDVGVFTLEAPRPTCTLAPRYLQLDMDADLQVRYAAEVTRGQHLEGAMRFPDGSLADTVDLRGRPMPEAFDLRDRRAAIDAYLRALQIYRATDVHRALGPSLVWFGLYKLERVHGDPALATAYLESAVARVLEGETGPGAEEIYSEWRQRQRPADSAP